LFLFDYLQGDLEGVSTSALDGLHPVADETGQPDFFPE
jgi:hypothetical protein